MTVSLVLTWIDNLGFKFNKNNINSFNFLLALILCLAIQLIVTGVTLAMHYKPSVLEAFNSVEHIMRDVNKGD